MADEFASRGPHIQQLDSPASLLKKLQKRMHGTTRNVPGVSTHNTQGDPENAFNSMEYSVQQRRADSRPRGVEAQSNQGQRFRQMRQRLCRQPPLFA